MLPFPFYGSRRLLQNFQELQNYRTQHSNCQLCVFWAWGLLSLCFGSMGLFCWFGAPLWVWSSGLLDSVCLRFVFLGYLILGFLYLCWEGSCWLFSLKMKPSQFKPSPASVLQRRPTRSRSGALDHPQAKERVCHLIECGVKEGAALLLDGRDIKVKGYEKGNFVGPTILAKVQVS